MSSLQFCEECETDHPICTQPQGTAVAYCERRIQEELSNQPVQWSFENKLHHPNVINRSSLTSIHYQMSQVKQNHFVPIVKLSNAIVIRIAHGNSMNNSIRMNQQSILKDITHRNNTQNINYNIVKPKIVQTHYKQQINKQKPVKAGKLNNRHQNSMLSTIREDNLQSERSYSVATATATRRLSSKRSSFQQKTSIQTNIDQIARQNAIYSALNKADSIKEEKQKKKRTYIMSGLLKRDHLSECASIADDENCCCL